MPDTAQKDARRGSEKDGQTSGWYVLIIAWIAYAVAFFVFSKTTVTAASDITNGQLLDIAHRYASFVGVALGLAALLATGIVYLAMRLILRKSSRLAALIITALGYAPWLVFGYDLVYREPRYVEIARVIITYLGKPMLYSAAIVCGCALILAALTLAFKKRIR